MTRDPIVEEVRAARDVIAREHGYDLAAIFDALRKMEEESDQQRVTLPPRKAKRSPSGTAVQPDVAPDGAPRRS